MGLKRAVSLRLAEHLTSSSVAAMERGSTWSLPRAVWPLLLKLNQRWLWAKVLEPVELRVQALIERDHPLGALRLPPPNDWNLTAAARMTVNTLVERNRPRRVIELGGGVSTIFLADYARRTSSTDGPAHRICSIDHDQGWLAKTEQDLKDRMLRDYVELIHAPLAAVTLDGREYQTYSLPSSFQVDHAPGSFDFCLIDGPPGHTSGRLGTLPLVAPYLAPGALVLLDDAFRDGEQSCLREWHELFPHSLRSARMYLTSRGLATARWEPGRTHAARGQAMTSGTVQSSA